MAWVNSGHSSSASLPCAQALRVDAGLLGDQALDHLLVRHFQREDGNVLLVQQGGVLGHREQETGFALARAAGDDEQVGGLQAGQLAVEVDETGRDAEDVLGALGELVDPVVVIAQHLADRLHILSQAPLADVEDGFLRLLDDVLDRLPLVVGQGGDLVGGGQHAAADGSRPRPCRP